MRNEINININSNEIKELSLKDPQLGKLITLIGNISIKIRQDRFASLISSIIGQQLSVKAARTIYTRFTVLMENKIHPDPISCIDDNTLRGIGISKQKIGYIRDLCEKVNNGAINLDSLKDLSDSEVKTTLIEIKGIGNWTAEMFLIFSLGRKNVLSLGDVGLQRACKWLYKADSKLYGKDLLAEKGEVWKPICSYASLYLWNSIDNGYVDSFNNIDEILSL
ncbi:DNA-3-methyladenine glycosylase family protein [Neobacillus vireti]|uniref:DNA-3-methyladenine glycosylase family protein n=1 Tax=Neobacillus vireti TaxID=220686 RepID=UPI002FFEB4F2